jgi:hypothetical protein
MIKLCYPFKNNSPYFNNSFEYLFFKECKNSFLFFFFDRKIYQTEEFYKYSFHSLSNGECYIFAEVLEC